MCAPSCCSICRVSWPTPKSSVFSFIACSYSPQVIGKGNLSGIRVAQKYYYPAMSTEHCSIDRLEIEPSNLLWYCLPGSFVGFLCVVFAFWTLHLVKFSFCVPSALTKPPQFIKWLGCLSSLRSLFDFTCVTYVTCISKNIHVMSRWGTWQSTFHCVSRHAYLSSPLLSSLPEDLSSIHLFAIARALFVTVNTDQSNGLVDLTMDSDILSQFIIHWLVYLFSKSGLI